MARVSDRGDQPIKCVPVVYDADFNCGLGVIYEDGQGQVWGMVSPRNLIAAWRGTEVLRLLDVIEHGTLHDAYHAGLRNPHESDLEQTVKPMIEKIGKKEHDRIMSAPVPGAIIRAILDNQNDEFKPDLYPITDEVRAGTIQWRKEFADAGIKHPNEIDAHAKAQEEIIAKFEKLLGSYATSAGLSRQCLGMNHVEGALLTIVDKGAGKTHPDHVLVALAGAVGSLATAEFAMFMMPFGPRSKEEALSSMARQKDEALTKAAHWLSADAGRPRFSFFRSRKDSMSFEDAKSLLGRLLAEYFPPKQQIAATA
ncbi:MAG: hypothetical protein KGI79_00845 [Patescibacteria group bacterium]|nr:hypothetical protein [Patescibacteria group bacterium]MDE2116410.1 hypothetical protein [Patescibacteria group bacterium]